MDGPPGTLLAGEIGKPHGVGGEVYVVRISDDPLRFEPGSTLIHGSGRRLTVEKARDHRNRFLVKFHGVDDRTAAERIRGPLFVRTTDLRSLGEDEFWPHELIGCAVVLADGTPVGSATDIRPGAAQDLLVVGTEGGEAAIPLVKEIVTSVDPSAGVITIEPPEGLLEP